jgi:hypothetical protein
VAIKSEQQFSATTFMFHRSHRSALIFIPYICHAAKIISGKKSHFFLQYTALLVFYGMHSCISPFEPAVDCSNSLQANLSATMDGTDIAILYTLYEQTNQSRELWIKTILP